MAVQSRVCSYWVSLRRSSCVLQALGCNLRVNSAHSIFCSRKSPFTGLKLDDGIYIFYIPERDGGGRFLKSRRRPGSAPFTALSVTCIFAVFQPCYLQRDTNLAPHCGFLVRVSCWQWAIWRLLKCASLFFTGFGLLSVCTFHKTNVSFCLCARADIVPGHRSI